MKVRVPDYYKNFKCIASKCEDTCCAGWVVVIDEKAHEKYKAVGGSFGERLKQEIVLDDGDNVFRLKDDNCAFLNEEKLCDIYKELGEEGLCHVCAQFPRVTEEFHDLKEVGISLSCPEAARIILNSSKKIDFEEDEMKETTAGEGNIDKSHLKLFIKCREVILNIIQNRSIPMEVRAALALMITEDVQEKIDWDEVEAIEPILEMYSKDDFINKASMELERYKNGAIIKYEIIKQWLEVYRNLTHINDNDPLNLENAFKCFYGEGKTLEYYKESHEAFDEFYKANEYKFEQILVYFIFRYFMKGIYDYDLSAKTKIAVLSYLIIKELSIVRWIENGLKFDEADMVRVARLYSKDVEHLEENIETLTELFINEEIFKEDNFLTVLMN